MKTLCDLRGLRATKSELCIRLDMVEKAPATVRELMRILCDLRGLRATQSEFCILSDMVEKAPMQDVEKLARIAVDCGLRVHRSLGPGLLESVYEAVLATSLLRAGLAVERQKPISIEFEGLIFREGFRADLVVEGELLIEVKSVERLAPIHAKQLLTYLRLSGRPLGLLMNFGGMSFREGVKRLANNYFAAG
ncbi:MAG TPA: GxxExxY protein [Allosphingosinicella sp.]|jgi:iron complex transport system substrate-binding protein